MVEKKEITTHEVRLDLEKKLQLEGLLHIPEAAKGIVLFAHGSGSSRNSPRNQYVAQFLQDQHIATLLFDLLTPGEEEIDEVTREIRFNIPFLAERLLKATDWISKYPDTRSFTIGYFGASTGAAAALIAAAELPNQIKAVVSRGGRPDLAGQALQKVQAATLLIVGGNDYGVIELNQAAYSLLGGKKKIEIVPGATHLFEEPGALGMVGRMAARWFSDYL